MINVYCTAKLIEKLPVSTGMLPNGKPFQNGEISGGANSMQNSTSSQPLSGWHANLLMFQRRQCVLMVHNQTRFPIFMIDLKKEDFAILDYHFTDAFMNTLLKVGANEKHMQAAQHLLAPLCINKSNDRSVQGTLNRMGADLEHMLTVENADIMDCSAYGAAAWLAERPCFIKSKKEGAAKSAKESVWPIEGMLKLLDTYAQS